MNSIKLWFQDWTDACTYAQECVPDLSFVQPFTALVSVAALCFVLWWMNERKIRQMRSSVRRAAPEGQARKPASAERARVLEEAGSGFSTAKKAA